MSHDILCPQSENFDKTSSPWSTGFWIDYSCKCESLAIVREKERSDIIEKVKKFIHNPGDDWLEAIDNLFIEKIVKTIETRNPLQ